MNKLGTLNSIGVAVGVNASLVLRLGVKDHDDHKQQTGENRLSVFTIQQIDTQDAYREQSVLTLRNTRGKGVPGNSDGGKQ